MERCRFLMETEERWVPPWVKHYLIIDARDVAMFKPMVSSRTTLLVVEDVVPRWLFRVPGFRRFWFSLRTRPVKNWILQQIVKLAAPAVIAEDVLLYTDSDTFFIAPFDPRSFERDGKVPLFLETGQRGLIRNNSEWQDVCSRLLGLSAGTDDDNNYVGNVIWWRRKNALEAVRRVQEASGMDWQRAIAPLSGFSEYILYGLHSHKILGAESGHWYDGVVRTLCYWETKPLSPAELLAFRARREPHHHSAMVSAKSRTPIADIRAAFADS